MSNPRIIEPMKINRIPDGKESIFPSLCASGEYFAELKKDGYWYMFEKDIDGEMYLWSRNVSKTTGLLTEKSANVPHIMECFENLPNDTIIIGEIYYPGKRSKDVTPIMGALPALAIERQAGEYGYLHYYIYDILFYNGTDLTHTRADVRYEILHKIYNKYSLFKYTMDGENPTIELAARVDDNIQEAVAAALDAGEEGMVLKKRTAPYTPGKRPAWDTIKIKKTDTCDVIIIGTCPATKLYDGKLDIQPNYCGKDASQWPYWAIFQSEEEPWGPKTKLIRKVPVGEYDVIKGIDYVTKPVTKAWYHGWDTAIKIGAYDGDKIVSIGTVSSGLTDEDKANLKTYVGQVCELAGMEKDYKAHTLRHFHFKRLRPDKVTSECTISSIFG